MIDRHLKHRGFLSMRWVQAFRMLLGALVLWLPSSARAQEDAFNTVQLNPAYWAAFDYHSGDLATLNHETGEVYVYPREYFSGDKDSVRGPWKNRQQDVAANNLCFARTADQVWIAVCFKNDERIYLIDPQSLETDAIVRTGSRHEVTDLNATTDPNAGLLFCQPGYEMAFIIDLKKMKNVGTVDNFKVRNVVDDVVLPSHDGTIVYGKHLACRRDGTSVEEIGRTHASSEHRVVADKQQRFATTGYLVLSSNFAREIAAFDFLIYDFAADGTIVAGIEAPSEFSRASLCLGSLSDFETFVRAPLPNLFSKSPPDVHYRDPRSVKANGNYFVFVDSEIRRVLVFHSGWVATLEYPIVAPPKMTLDPFAGKFPDQVEIGQTYEVKLEVPDGSELTYEPSDGIRFDGSTLTWNVGVKHLDPTTFEIVPRDDSPVTSKRVPATWPYFLYSFKHSGAFLEDDIESSHRNYGWDEPWPNGMAADNDWVTVWYSKTLLILDATSGEQISAQRFESNVSGVTFGKQHIYVELKPDPGKEVYAVTRDGQFTAKRVDALSGVFRPSAVDGLVYRDGITFRDGVQLDPDSPRTNACLDSDLSPLEIDDFAKLRDNHVYTDGMELGDGVGRPVLLVGIEDPHNAFAESQARNQVLALGEPFIERSNRMPHLARSRELASVDCPSRGVFIQADLSREKIPLGTWLAIHPYDEAFPPHSVRILRGEPRQAKIAGNDSNLYYATEAKLFVIPFHQLNLPVQSSPLEIKHRQSTFSAETNKSTNLNYTIVGGSPPYEIRAACWLSGKKPDNIQRKLIKSQDGSLTLTLTASELETAATAFLSEPPKGVPRNADISEMLENFKATYQPLFEKLVGRAPKGIPIPLPVRLQVIDSAGDQVFLGHYLFFELSARDATAAMDIQSQPR